MQLVVCVEVRDRDIFDQNEHQAEHGDHEAPVSDCEEEIEDYEYVSCHVHHVLNGFNNLSIKDIHVSREDVQDFANRRHIKEDVHRGFQDSPQSFFVHVSSDLFLHSIQYKVSNYSQSQT